LNLTSGVAHKKTIAFGFALLALVGLIPTAQAKGDDFGAVVKLIEQFYHVKHKGIPFLALVTIEPQEACVVQVDLSLQNLAALMRNPDEMGKTITIEATTDEP